MPQNCIAPKPEEYLSSLSVEASPPNMADTQTTSTVLTYPISTNEQSLVPKLIMYPITLKVTNYFTFDNIIFIHTFCY